MRKMPMALLTALLASACTAAPGEPVPAEMTAQSAAQQRVTNAAAAPEGAGFIESVAYTGTGCEGNTTTSAFSPDKQVVTSIFSAFVADVGPNSQPDSASRNCLLMMDINVPSGWSYSLESVDYRGFAALESGVTASRQSLYMISGSPVHVTAPARFKGAFTDDYTHPDVGPEVPGVWSPCGGGQVLWIATQTEVSNGARPAREGQLTVDTIDTELQWRRCQ